MKNVLRNYEYLVNITKFLEITNILLEITKNLLEIPNRILRIKHL